MKAELKADSPIVGSEAAFRSSPGLTLAGSSR